MMEYFDDSDVKKSAAIIKKYCELHTHCRDCIFRSMIKYNGQEIKIYCKLHHSVPGHWELKEDKK